MRQLGFLRQIFFMLSFLQFVNWFTTINVIPNINYTHIHFFFSEIRFVTSYLKDITFYFQIYKIINTPSYISYLNLK